MNKNIIALSLILISGSALAVPNVSDNTVRFKGEVSNQTCSLDINGNKQSPVVLLPTVSINEFKTADAVTKGKTAGETEFTINVSGCSSTTGSNGMESSLKIGFLGNLVTAGNNLGNTGTAKDISIQLVDNNSSSFVFTAGDLIASQTSISIAEDGSVTPTTYKARYYAEETTATAGSVIASAQYAITYK